MVDVSPDENPYDAPVDTELINKERSYRQPISRVTFFYQYAGACFPFFIIITMLYVFPLVLLPDGIFNTAASIPVHICVCALAVLLTRVHLRFVLADQKSTAD